MRDPNVLSTGQVANLLGVANRTVHKWFDSGRLEGWRIPGSRDRRFSRKTLLRFCLDHGIPTDDIDTRPHLLLVTQDAPLASRLRRAVSEEQAIVTVVSNGFDAGRAADRGPQLAVVDFAIGASDAANVCRQVKQLSRAVVLAILAPGMDCDRIAIDETMRRPLDVDFLAQRVAQLSGAAAVRA